MALTALIIDDDQTVQHLLADTLAQEGFAVLAEKDGEWALKTLESKKIDVVLLDLLLPSMHGFEVAQYIRMLPNGADVPIIFVSGVYRSEIYKAESKNKFGIIDFLEKPIHLGRLKESLHQALGQAYPRGPASAPPADDQQKRPLEQFADPAAHEEVAAVENAARKTALQTIQGNFSTKPFPELLAELYRWRATGALLLRQDKIKKIAYFREGRPFYIKSNLLSECLGNILVREKMVSEADGEESLRRMKSSGRQHGTVLIEMGCISPHNLAYALAHQLRVKLHDVFTWTHGDYQFNAKVEMPSETNSLDFTTAQIIYEGVKRAYDEKRVRQMLGNVESLYAHPARAPLLRFQELGLDEEETSLLAAIDGRKTVSALLALNLIPQLSTLQFLYAMRCSQMIDLLAEPAPASAEPPPAKPPSLPPVSEPAKEPVAWSKPVPASKPPPLPGALLPEIAQASETARDDEQTVRQRLAAIAASMKKKDYFQILRVDQSASKDDIQRAYLGLAQEYHPDKHFRSCSAEVRDLAAQILQLATTARDTLVDDQEREQYLSGLNTGAHQDQTDGVAKILAAEGKFQKGEDLLRKGQFKDASQSFKEAVELYGEEGEFHTFLGWSLFKIDPNNNAEKAIERIEAGIRLNPKVDKSYLFLGRIYQAMSRPDRAEKQFEKALQANPDCIEALRELRLLGRSR